MSYKITQIYTPAGINYSLPETVRKINYARDGLNFEITPSQDLVKRKGYAIKAGDDAGFGLYSYGQWSQTVRTDGGWGVIPWGTGPWGSPVGIGFGEGSEKLIGLDDNVNEWTTGTLNIAYSGATSASVLISATASADIKCIVQENGSTVLSSSLGDGISVVTPTITSLAASIDALSGFTTTVTGTGTTPACYLDYVNTEGIATSGSLDIGFGYWTQKNSPVSAPLANNVSRAGEALYENPTVVSFNGILYIADGYDRLMKYDSANVYRAGVPQAVISSVSVDTSTVVSAGFSGSYKYKISFKQVDKFLNVHEGLHSAISSAVDNSSGPYAVDISYTPLQTAEGYLTNCAIVDGAQSSTNVAAGQERLTVDDGSGGAHTMLVGDTAYFYDTITSDYVELEVLAVTSSTITLDSDSTVTVTDNQVISANLRAQIWRTKAGGTLYYLVEEIPHDSFSVAATYSDTKIDDDLGSVYNDTLRVRAEPPYGKYIVSWRNQLVIAGDPLNSNIVYYSQYADDTSPENFPGVNSFLVGQDAESPISALAVLGRNLFIFTDESTYLVEGNLAEHRYEISLFASNIGCVSHHSIQVVDDTLIFLSKKGVYRIRPSGGGYSVIPISADIMPIFDISAPNNYRNYWKRVSSAYWAESQKYLLFLPIESTRADTTKYATSDSVVWVFDTIREMWYKWDNINAHGGITIFDDAVLGEVPWFSSRESAANYLYRFNYTKSEIDYSDRVSAVTTNYLAQWDFAGDTTLAKLYTDCSIESFRLSDDLNFNPTGALTVGVYKNFDSSTELLNFSLTPAADDDIIIEALPLVEMRSIGLKFSDSTINNQFLISGWSYEMMPYIRNMRRT